MRPPKVILCVNGNEEALSILVYMLRVNHYRVLPATSESEAIDLLCQYPVELVIADFVVPPVNGVQLIARLKQIALHIPMILLGDSRRLDARVCKADAILSRAITAVKLLECVKVMSARKRGPRKSIVIPQYAATA